MRWREEFSPDFRVPEELDILVGQGFLEETSWRSDPAPSFGARLKDKTWLRIWVGRPLQGSRAGGRFILLIQDDPASYTGTLVIQTDLLEELFQRVDRLLWQRGRKRPNYRLNLLVKERFLFVTRTGRWEPYHPNVSRARIARFAGIAKWNPSPTKTPVLMRS